MPAKRSDKEVIHLDYITTDLSLRVLAKKHSVAVSTLKKWKDDGHWDVERKALLADAAQQAREKFDTDVAQALNGMTDRLGKILESADKLLLKVDQLLALEDALAPRDLKSISSVLVDVMTMQNMDKSGDNPEDSKNTITVRWVDNPWDKEGGDNA